MQKPFFGPATSSGLLPALALALLTGPPALAQKVQDAAVAAAYAQAPVLALKPQYATYSVEYDLGTQAMNVATQPALQGLTYQKSGGDLRLRFTAKNLYVSGRTLNEANTTSGYSCAYTLNYTGEFGYELRDLKTDQVLDSYQRTGGSVTTAYFRNRRTLDSYADNTFVGEQSRQLLDALLRRADFRLNPHQYRTELTLNTVTGDAPAYAAISQATADFKTLLAAGPAPDPARLAALGGTWRQYLAQADWENKKSAINKKVAGALLENLCALALLANDYAALSGYEAAYVQHRVSTFGLPLQFKTDMSYGGTGYTGGTANFMGHDLNKTLRVNYADVAAELRLGK